VTSHHGKQNSSHDLRIGFYLQPKTKYGVVKPFSSKNTWNYISTSHVLMIQYLIKHTGNINFSPFNSHMCLVPEQSLGYDEKIHFNFITLQYPIAIPHSSSCTIWGWYNRPSTKWTQLSPYSKRLKESLVHCLMQGEITRRICF
jgi:hypothetical protein